MKFAKPKVPESEVFAMNALLRFNDVPIMAITRMFKNKLVSSMHFVLDASGLSPTPQ